MYEKEIRRGIAWLENRHPVMDLDMIDLRLLELADWDKCILGQLLGGVKCNRLITAEPEWAEAHGFFINDPEGNDDDASWTVLTNEWVVILRARRTAPESEVTT